LSQAEGIDKVFPGVQALDYVDFDHREVMVVFDQWRRRRLGV
jgi:ABC-type sugar transport system ATPase subunit